MNANQILERLKFLAYRLGKKEKFGIESTSKVYTLLNEPGKGIPKIHIGGTNGKGSVANKIAFALEASGYKTALFTSPHLFDLRERIQINHQMIELEKFYFIMEKTFKFLDEKKIDLNFFEVLFIAAMEHFCTEKVDFCIIEVGLGGKRDATNIILPILSIITSISLDHTEILGSTVEEIAQDKAGIIKSNIPILVGPNANFSKIYEIAKIKSAPIYKIEGFFEDFDKENTAIAAKALEIIDEKYPLKKQKIQKAIQKKPPARFQIIKREVLQKRFSLSPKVVVFDVAHNEDGLRNLFKMLKNKYKKQKFVTLFSISKSKSIDRCTEVIKENSQFIYLAKTDHGRLENPENIAASLKEWFYKEYVIASSIADAFLKMLEDYSLKEEVLVVCGSFFIMEPIFSLFEKNTNDLNITEMIRF